jgi:hypothetical protein
LNRLQRTDNIFLFKSFYSFAETYTRREISVKAAKESGANTLTDLVKLLNGGL